MQQRALGVARGSMGPISRFEGELARSESWAERKRLSAREVSRMPCPPSLGTCTAPVAGTAAKTLSTKTTKNRGTGRTDMALTRGRQGGDPDVRQIVRG